jgi:ATP-dependent DNA helicase RecG
MEQLMNKDTPLEKIFRLTPVQRKALAKMGLRTAENLIRFFPRAYGELGKVKAIESLQAGEAVTVFAKISKLETKKGFKSRIPMGEATLDDGTSKIKVIWFNQPYIAKMFGEESLVRIEGKVSQRKTGELYFSNPKIEKAESIPNVEDSLFGKNGENHSLSPVYAESAGITTNWIYHAIQKVFRLGILKSLEDSIPPRILEKYHLPSLNTALIWIHAPKSQENAEVARKRFAFEEIFLIQLDRQKERILSQREKTFMIKKSKKDMEEFTHTFPFPLTGAQDRTLNTILGDFRTGYPMSRLLEGDVGSGKTAVAASACFAVVTTAPPKREFGNLQIAYMAPTEILAEQHFESFIEYFKKFKIPVGLITGSGAKKFPSKVNSASWTKVPKPQLLKWVASGEIPILIGTHSLIYKSVRFKNLGFIIIDEQHRFGVKQRKELRRKTDITPHLLSMTATPIPRTLALTIFGDLDLSILDELPPGRKPVETKIVTDSMREEVYENVRKELRDGRQAYVICPRIDQADLTREFAINAASVKEMVEVLKKKFPNFEVKGLTGKKTPKEKEEIMREFKDKKIDILVATSVVEVGVNVPNATVIIIENAERFGLAQLHQLRGRVLRSSHKPYCFVFADSKSKKTIDRLKSFANSRNGFELAEADLAQRGTGDLAGVKQWGVSDLAMEALRNIKMVEAARLEARTLIEQDFDLKHYPLLHSRLTQTSGGVHME